MMSLYKVELKRVANPFSNKAIAHSAGLRLQQLKGGMNFNEDDTNRGCNFNPESSFVSQVIWLLPIARGTLITW